MKEKNKGDFFWVQRNFVYCGGKKEAGGEEGRGSTREGTKKKKGLIFLRIEKRKG